MKRVIITGPESTGKSTLTKQLAEHFNTAYVDEYAREFLACLEREYREEDLLTIAQGQSVREKAAMLSADTLLFSDTSMLVMKVWSEYKYNRCDEWILRELKTNQPDIFLLANTDIPWEADVLRENPNEREELYAIYHRELTIMQADFIEIKGLGEARLQSAINAVETLLKK